MPRYKIIMQYPDGVNEEQDEVFETEESAEEYANYLVSCSQVGAEILIYQIQVIIHLTIMKTLILK